MASPQDTETMMREYFNGRSRKYDLYMTEFKKAETNTESASKGTLAKICNMLLDDLKLDNDFLQMMIQQTVKLAKRDQEFRGFLLTTNIAVQFALRKLDTIESNSEDRSEIAELNSRLSSIEDYSKKYKPIFEEIELRVNEIDEAKKDQRPAPVADYIK